MRDIGATFWITCIVLLAITLKWFYNQASLDQLMWILSPTTFLLECMSGWTFYWDDQLGYVNEANKVHIEKSCSGVHFLIICSFMSICSFIGSVKGFVRQGFFFFLLLLLSYILSIFTNASRIYVALLMKPLGDSIPFFSKNITHMAVGVLFYVTAIVGYYFLLRVCRGRITIRPNCAVMNSGESLFAPTKIKK